MYVCKFVIWCAIWPTPVMFDNQSYPNVTKRTSNLPKLFSNLYKPLQNPSHLSKIFVTFLTQSFIHIFCYAQLSENESQVNKDIA